MRQKVESLNIVFLRRKARTNFSKQLEKKKQFLGFQWKTSAWKVKLFFFNSLYKHHLFYQTVPWNITVTD